jgi:DNA-binding response OmpR family regulator/EAL domain-containing protein (putative c-di-GMP-specific phosphodiesterase class I)
VENTQQGAGASSDNTQPPGLKHKLAAQLKAWRTALSDPWDPARAEALHAELEGLAEEAAEAGFLALGDVTLALDVFLCSVVDKPTPPSPAQRTTLDGLLARFDEALGGTARPAPQNKRNIVYVAPNPVVYAALKKAFAGRGSALRPYRDVAHALQAKNGASIDAVLVDEACIAELHALIAGLAAQREASQGTLPCLVLSSTMDPAHTLFAQRAGADAVVPHSEPQRVLTRLDELLARQQSVGYRVLVVDDDRVQAQFCESVLHHRGIATEVCADAAGVLDAIARFRPDLVLLDIYLPDGNGIDVAQAIRQQPGLSLLPVVFLSGEHDLDRRFDAISMGGDDFLTKPVKPRHLLLTVESRVRRARAMHSEPAGASERRGLLSGRELVAREALLAPIGETALLWIVPERLDAARDVLGFVEGGELAKQLAAGVAAELPLARPLCAVGEAGFVALMRYRDEAELHENIAKARERLDARAWVRSVQPLRLQFSIAALALDRRWDHMDELWQRLRELGQQLLDAGGSRCAIAHSRAEDAAENPQGQMIGDLLRGNPPASAFELQFQPLIPLLGQAVGQFRVRMNLVPPRAGGVRLDSSTYLPVVERQQLRGALDRRFLRAVLTLAAEHGEDPTFTQLLVPIGADSVRDLAFAPWLAAELRSHSVPPRTLALSLRAEALQASTPHDVAFDALARTGARLCLRIEGDTATARRWLTVPDFSMVELALGDGLDVAATPLLREARALGKITVVSGVTNPSSVTSLMNQEAHYVCGTALTGWLPSLQFDFAEAEL